MVAPRESIGTGASRSCPDCGKRPDFKVLRSAAGFYIGTHCDCGPYSRESDYYKTHQAAQKDLDSGIYGRS